MSNPIFVEHPHPWRIDPNRLTGENGGNVAAIVDANNKVVVGNFWMVGKAFNALWELYCQLTPEQIDSLSHPEPDKNLDSCPDDSGE